MVALTAQQTCLHPQAEKLEQLFERFLQQNASSKLAAEAEEAVHFYRKNWALDEPDWDQRLQKATAPNDEALLVVEAVKELFGVFGHWLPRAFYDAFLAPINQGSIYEPVSLLFSLELKDEAFWRDPVYHILNVTFLQKVVQDVFAKRGLFFVHTCGCGCHFSKVAVKTDVSTLDEQQFANTVWGAASRLLDEFKLFASQTAISGLTSY